MALRRPGFESAAAALASALVALWIGHRLLAPGVFEGDALVHQYWMWHWRDAGLFNDPLTAELRDSARYPAGYQALFRLATLVVSPIVFGEWLGVGLMAVSGWLVWRIVRDHTAWRPAAWLGAALYLSVFDILRFSGGFPRAFIQPLVLLTVLLLLRGHRLAAALVAGGAIFFYPPAAVLAVGVVCVCALRWEGRRPGLDRRAALFALLALAVAAVGVLVSGPSPRVLTAAEARQFPEFNPGGTLHFFASSTFEYLRQNRSGFDLRTSGTILVAAGLAILLLRPRNLRLLRAPVLAMPVVSLAAYGAAQLVLFRLYLPHRYTYPLLAFFAIAIAVSLRPTWEALWPRRAAVGAVATGATVLGLLLVIPAHHGAGWKCAGGPAVRYLASLPKDAIVAGDPIDLNCLPGTARRAVVISSQLAPSYEAAYFRSGRERMFAMLDAYYGASPAGLAEVRERYGATDLWVRRDAIAAELRHEGRWSHHGRPYRGFVGRLTRAGEPAVLHLPVACRRFANGPNEVYDLRCVVDRTR